MQFLNQHNSKYQKRSKHFVCTRFPGSSMFCIGWQPDYVRLLTGRLAVYASPRLVRIFTRISLLCAVFAIFGTLDLS